ncbi:squalene/phytoene synthase family protein [Yoonia sp. F2084L]|uniref:squalene/phytoene synthase family protein n=1 Tax=Yoonia sp. F2084L TaxID=2926419 RepID=UPI001FF47B52|nr:squalene/phytoene synthase family protein [Yoonia sp. F2084L]MCK0094680.1 squalene/phytoene synthase family protein [Yoonia sp. F2084L]
MSFEACAALVEKADPLRFRVAMAAPVAARRTLFPLYAFNVEVARAPWVTQEAIIAEMRLQWWRDALEEIAEGKTPRRHEVVDALASCLDREGAQCLDGLVAARRWDVYKDPFEDQAHFDAYINATSGHLMWTAARLLGAAEETTVRDFAYGVGVANIFQAVPALQAQTRVPLIDCSNEAISRLAGQGLDRLGKARGARRTVSKASGPALVAGYHARPVLQMVRDAAERVIADALDSNPARDSLRFLNVSLRGWWR